MYCLIYSFSSGLPFPFRTKFKPFAGFQGFLYSALSPHFITFPYFLFFKICHGLRTLAWLLPQLSRNVLPLNLLYQVSPFLIPCSSILGQSLFIPCSARMSPSQKGLLCQFHPKELLFQKACLFNIVTCFIALSTHLNYFMNLISQFLFFTS